MQNLIVVWLLHGFGKLYVLFIFIASGAGEGTFFRLLADAMVLPAGIKEQVQLFLLFAICQARI